MAMTGHVSDTKRKAGRQRHVPQRTCNACRRIGPKTSFVRLVLRPTGMVEVDETGKKTGRGAYLCPQIVCWQKGLNEKALNRAFRTNLLADSLNELSEYMRTRLSGDSEREGI